MLKYWKDRWNCQQITHQYLSAWRYPLTYKQEWEQKQCTAPWQQEEKPALHKPVL